MACNSCISGNYDFTIKELDSKSFLYQDLSSWQEGLNYCKPELYDVFVYTPGCTDAVKVSVSSSQATQITPSVLWPDGSCDKIKDGIYYFSIEEGAIGYCGKIFRKSEAIIPALQCCFDKAFMTYSVLRKEELKHVDFLIRATRVNAKVGNLEMSQDYYDQAKSALKKFECNCSY